MDFKRYKFLCQYTYSTLFFQKYNNIYTFCSKKSLAEDQGDENRNIYELKPYASLEDSGFVHVWLSDFIHRSLMQNEVFMKRRNPNSVVEDHVQAGKVK